MASRAPHASDGHVAYSGRCRPSAPCYGAVAAEANLRLMVPPCPGAPGSDEVSFDDLICGRQNVALSGYFGDFVLRRKGGDWAYQFAVAVDDADMGVTEVVRGDDLLMSTAPQRYVMSLLELPEPVVYAHLPLLKKFRWREAVQARRSLVNGMAAGQLLSSRCDCSCMQSCRGQS